MLRKRTVLLRGIPCRNTGRRGGRGFTRAPHYGIYSLLERAGHRSEGHHVPHIGPRPGNEQDFSLQPSGGDVRSRWASRSGPARAPRARSQRRGVQRCRPSDRARRRREPSSGPRSRRATSPARARGVGEGRGPRGEGRARSSSTRSRFSDGITMGPRHARLVVAPGDHRFDRAVHDLAHCSTASSHSPGCDKTMQATAMALARNGRTRAHAVQRADRARPLRGQGHHDPGRLRGGLA